MVYLPQDLIIYEANGDHNGEVTLNQTAYALHDPVYIGVQRACNMLFEYAVFTSAITRLLLLVEITLEKISEN